MLSFKFDLGTQFENPIVSALIIAATVIVILFFVVPDLTFHQVRCVFVPSVIAATFVFYMQYKQMKKKFHDNIVDHNTTTVMERLSVPM